MACALNTMILTLDHSIHHSLIEKLKFSQWLCIFPLGVKTKLTFFDNCILQLLTQPSIHTFKEEHLYYKCVASFLHSGVVF